MSQTRLAALSGVSVATVRVVQRGGGGRRVRDTTLTSLCRALDWPDDHLLHVLLGTPRDATVASAVGAGRGLRLLSDRYDTGTTPRPEDGARAPARRGMLTTGTVVTVTVWPGQQPEELREQLAQMPAGMVFIEAFGDLSPVLVFGPAGVALPRRVVETAVVATLTDWDD
ncbi:hypothetical protein [Frankia nepalensis]|nr:hypothetical protein [Frankia nepalensis]